MIEITRTISIKEQCEIMEHIGRKAQKVLDKSETYIEENVYQDIYEQALREAGVNNLADINSQYLYAIHEAIDCYVLPKYLANDRSLDNQ